VFLSPRAENKEKSASLPFFLGFPCFVDFGLFCFPLVNFALGVREGGGGGTLIKKNQPNPNKTKQTPKKKKKYFCPLGISALGGGGGGGGST